MWKCAQTNQVSLKNKAYYFVLEIRCSISVSKIGLPKTLNHTVEHEDMEVDKNIIMTPKLENEILINDELPEPPRIPKMGELPHPVTLLQGHEAEVILWRSCLRLILHSGAGI